MIKQIELDKFKSYDQSAIELAPITLLCGGNSSGKTSIIKSILLLLFRGKISMSILLITSITFGRIASVIFGVCS